MTGPLIGSPEVEKRLGISTSTVHRLRLEGKLTGYPARGRAFAFCPTEVEALRIARAAVEPKPSVTFDSAKPLCEELLMDLSVREAHAELANAGFEVTLHYVRCIRGQMVRRRVLSPIKSADSDSGRSFHAKCRRASEQLRDALLNQFAMRAFRDGISLDQAAHAMWNPAQGDTR